MTWADFVPLVLPIVSLAASCFVLGLMIGRRP